MLEEINLQYKVIPINLSEGEQFKEDFVKMSPFSKIPVIKEDDNDTEHFVHVSGLIDRITEGDKVEFELKEGNKGLNAINVKVIS